MEDKAHNLNWAGIPSLQYLHQNVFNNLAAVIMHAYVTGEGLAEEYISVWCEDKNSFFFVCFFKKHLLLFNFKELQLIGVLPKVLW